MAGSIEVFIGVKKKVTIIKRLAHRNLKGYRLFIYRMSIVTKKDLDGMKIAVEVIVTPS